VAFQVAWTVPELRQFNGAVEWIRLDQPLVADRFADGVLSRVRKLRQFPRSGAIYHRKRGLEIRQITFQKFRILYRVFPRLQKVEILFVWHGSRREPNIRRARRRF
jgi:toxin ParE1/3/4